MNTDHSDIQAETEQALGDLESLVRYRGVPVFGVADLSSSSIGVRYFPSEIVSDLTRAIVLGYRLSDRVIESLIDRPTSTYRYHYRQANQVLDSAASAVVAWIQERGHSALPIPSSQIIDWEENRGHLWHVATACKAGVAWWGRNNLAVTQLYGARVRYATVLTDMQLPSGAPLERDCGDCVSCIGACPAGAIGYSPEEFDVGKCDALLKRFSKELSLGVKICGLCVKACVGENTWRPKAPA